MPEVVKVSEVESGQKLAASIQEYFKKGRYTEIAQLIGMHSILVDPEHMISDQNRLYRSVLELIKNRIAGILGKRYSSWYSEFSTRIDKIVTGGQVVTDKSSSDVLASHRAAYGPFKSVEDFFFWALEDRRLTLDQIVQYVEKTAEMSNN